MLTSGYFYNLCQQEMQMLMNLMIDDNLHKDTNISQECKILDHLNEDMGNVLL